MSNRFARDVLDWYRKHGRHDLPWQRPATPYRVWVSEIMLQQTRVTTVIPYFERFMERFPDVHALAAADLDEVLELWTGLGYYARARNLHRAARILCQEHDGQFPDDVDTLNTLPGIGRSTAGAIASLGYGRPASILDGNVKRVLCRCFAVSGWPGRSAVNRQLWQLAEELTPSRNTADYNQAMMDLGATVCTRRQPACDRCPLHRRCQARRDGNVADYPERKPARAKPIHHVYMLLCADGAGRVLLEKRPPSGIWGGLWSLPECGDREQLDAFCDRHGACVTGEWQPLRHSFTHFHLDITPVEVAMPGERAVRESGQQLWYPLDHSVTVGMAAPVKKLLERAGAADTAFETRQAQGVDS